MNNRIEVKIKHIKCLWKGQDIESYKKRELIEIIIELAQEIEHIRVRHNRDLETLINIDQFEVDS